MVDPQANKMTSFVADLREATRDLHVRAERTGFIADLLQGRGRRDGYVLLLRNLLPAYEALERGLLRHASSPIFSGLAWPALFRAQALQRDLEAIAGEQWRATVALLPEGVRYAERIETIEAGNGERLLAHAYTRYLGDLSGGQILAGLLTRSLGLRPGELSFYSFTDVADSGCLKADFRQYLATAGALVDRGAVIEEAAAAFRHNIELSEAIKARS